MTAGVQSIDSSAYLPPPPSAPGSSPDAKAAGGAGRPASDPQAPQTPGEPSEFQSELQQQDAGTQEARPDGFGKTDSGKSGKKRETRPDDSNLSTVTPVQVAEPQKQILPFTLALPQPQPQMQPEENTKLEGNARRDVAVTLDKTAPTNQTVQEPVQPAGPALAAVPTAPRPSELAPPVARKQPAAPKLSAKLQQLGTPVEPPPNLAANAAANAAANVTANAIPSATSATPDLSKASPLASAWALIPQIPVQKAAAKSEDSSSQEQDPNQTVTSAKSNASSDRQPVSRTELTPPVIPEERVATAVHETVDSAPSSPSALAFAARLAPAPQKTDQSAAAIAAPIQALSGAQTADRIPVRYAAMAQILPNAGADTKALKKDPSTVIDQPVRMDARTDSRTDLVLPRLESVGQAPSAGGSAAPQPAAPSAQMARVIEPPPAPATSTHDIRVRVPDNNGGSTQVRFVESGGEVRVSVRTSDEGLAQNLRTHLNDLTQRLSDGGMPAEIWKPASNAASSQNDPHPPHSDGRGPGGQGSGGQSGQQDRQQRRPAWLEEMEASLDAQPN